MARDLTFSSDVVVVGSGPGGATIARELARAGRRVMLVERGIDHRDKSYYGTYIGALMYSDRMSLLFTREGLQIVSPLMLGGATSMYCGCSARPPAWLKRRYKIDIDREVLETEKELEIAPLPSELRGRASTRIAEAAGELGYRWYAQPKFMKPSRAARFDCTASCMLGCRCGAKWNAAEYVDQASGYGLEVLTGARVTKVIVDGGHAAGVEGRMGMKSFTVRAGTVVLAAGGIGSPRILQASGLRDAGVGMTMDTTVMVYGFTREKGIGKEPPMTWSWENDEDGYMLSTLIDPWLLYPLGAIRVGLRYALKWPRWGNILGVMIKLKDDISGGVYPNYISKQLTPGDRSRLAKAEGVCKKILIKAGADPSCIFTRPLMGTHPSGTVRIDTMLDKNLMTEVKGLYVCDASVFPESLDRPTVLTIIALGKRLAGHMLRKKK